LKLKRYYTSTLAALAQIILFFRNSEKISKINFLKERAQFCDVAQVMIVHKYI
jgi:hypothetical protein